MDPTATDVADLLNTVEHNSFLNGFGDGSFRPDANITRGGDPDVLQPPAGQGRAWRNDLPGCFRQHVVHRGRPGDLRSGDCK